MPDNRRFLLVRRPKGEPVPEDFSLVTEPTPALAEGQFLIRNHYASLDPAIRGWMDDAPSYMPPIPLGDPVRASTIGIVEASKADGFVPGQWVMGLNGIEDYSVGTVGGFTQPIDAILVPSVTNYLSVLGAVGSLVGQIAKIKGASKVIGIAGGPAKCAKLTDRYGFDAAIDYRGKDVQALTDAIRAEAPDGVDIIFENVGGDILDAGLNNLRHGARIGLCGLISEYNSVEKVGARNIWQLIVHRASIRGLLVADYIPRFAEGGAEMAAWLQQGKMTADEHVDEGIENSFDAFMRLFAGSNQGKMILKIA